MKRNIIVGLLLLFLPFLGAAAHGIDDSTNTTPNRLFHIARSANRNLVCYDVNLKDGRLNAKEPLNVYWLNREERPGETNGLSFIQRKLAYGYKVISASPEGCTCTLTAYPKRQLTIKRLPSGYVCLVKINRQLAVLQSLFVKAHAYNPLKVEYVELHGVALATQRPVTERVRNN